MPAMCSGAWWGAGRGRHLTRGAGVVGASNHLTETKMERDSVQVLRNFRLERGGKYASPTCAAEIAAERLVRERFAALVQRRKGPRDCAIYNVAENRSWPTRRPAKLMRRLRRKHRLDFAEIYALVIEPQIQFLAQECGRSPAA